MAVNRIGPWPADADTKFTKSFWGTGFPTGCSAVYANYCSHLYKEIAEALQIIAVRSSAHFDMPLGKAAEGHRRTLRATR